MSQRVQGKVIRWFSKKGFGFIGASDEGCDIFVHYSEILFSNRSTNSTFYDFKSLTVGQLVEFDIVTQDNGKRKAINVTEPGNYIDKKIIHVYNETDYNRQKIQKIGEDTNVSYGDGGECDLVWNIYMCKKLEHVNKKILKKLVKDLIQLGETNNDWRENEPIKNIIDPELFIYKYYEKNWVKDEYKKQFDIKYSEWWGDGAEEWKQILTNEQKGYYIRRKYQWLSTQFMENSGKISICSPIHDIPSRVKYKNIYRGIEHIFERMLPLFNKFEKFRDRKQKEFQVVLKSQRYCLEDMSGYSGHWHQEGLTENIIIVGLYYYELNEGLTDGCLKFRNLQQPTKHYAEDLDAPLAQEIYVIREGTAVVFNNVTLVHRLRMLKNKVGDKQTRYRSFLAFFIVDPEKPISSTRDITLHRDVYVKCISDSTPINAMDVIMLICEYGACGYTLEEAKNIRKLNIDIRKKTRGRWGSVDFGNSGDQIWFGNGKDQQEAPSDQICWLSTTNSELT